MKCAIGCALFVTLLSAGCSLQMNASLLKPLNRELSGRGEIEFALVAEALLDAGLSEEEVETHLVTRGATEDNARRLIALAKAKLKRGAAK